jgi:hypothetical protein
LIQQAFLDVSLNPDLRGFTFRVGYMTFASTMLQISLAAPILAGAQLQVCHVRSNGVALSGSRELLGGPSSSFGIRKAERSAEWSRFGTFFTCNWGH